MKYGRFFNAPVGRGHLKLINNFLLSTRPLRHLYLLSYSIIGPLTVIWGSVFVEMHGGTLQDCFISSCLSFFLYIGWIMTLRPNLLANLWQSLIVVFTFPASFSILIQIHSKKFCQLGSGLAHCSRGGCRLLVFIIACIGILWDDCVDVR